MKINLRYLLILPIGLLFFIIKINIERYQEIISAHFCVNFFNTPVPCSGYEQIGIIVFGIVGIFICMVFLMDIHKKIKFIWK